ncbi:hypothetical protein DFH94DRAFT_636705, partial [Russula ochroleuca]
FGITMTSLEKLYYRTFLVQGDCLGVDAGMLFVTSTGVRVVSTHSHNPFRWGLSCWLPSRSW